MRLAMVLRVQMTGGVMRLLMVLGILESTLHACAADPGRVVTDAASIDSSEDTVSLDHPTFESDVLITCASAEPIAIPLQSDGDGCLFQISPLVPSGEFINGVRADGVALPATEFELQGGDRLELTGQACIDYHAGKITNVSPIVACID